MSTATKMPQDTRLLIGDPDLAAAVEKMLHPYAGKELERAQAAIRQVRGSGVQGTFTQVLDAYRVAIQKAAGKTGVEGE